MVQCDINERERPVFSASAVLGTLADALSAIRKTDNLTFSDIAAVLGKSEDQAAKYCAGSAAMDAITFGRAKREWNGRFTGAFDRLCVESRPATANDRAHGSSVLKAALALSVALEGDGQIDESDVRIHRSELEDARDAIEAVLGKLKPPERGMKAQIAAIDLRGFLIERRHRWDYAMPVFFTRIFYSAPQANGAICRERCGVCGQAICGHSDEEWSS